MLRLRALFVLALLGLGLVAALSSAPEAQTFGGPARVIDGDTLEVAGRKVRLFAIDTPEDGQRCRDEAGQAWNCARWATRQTRAAIDGRRLLCTARDVDPYGRIVASCAVDGRDLGATLVERGVAVALPEFGRDYVDAEKRASVAGRGLWAGEFQRPSDWRAAQRSAAAQPAAAAPVRGCAIKGNISDSGRIFHVPGQRDYERTRISPERGERWFCSEAEARAAGWRKAQR